MVSWYHALGEGLWPSCFGAGERSIAENNPNNFSQSINDFSIYFRYRKMASTGSRWVPMKTLLFAHDVIALWAAQLKVVCIPAIVVGAAIGCILRHWIACLAVSYAAALGLVAIVPDHQLHHPMSVSKLLMWSAVLVLPAILASTSLGYFAARWIQTRRAKQPVT
jgi:hypothetical protein